SVIRVPSKNIKNHSALSRLCESVKLVSKNYDLNHRFKYSGNPSTVKSHNIGNIKYTNKVKMTIEMMFITKPFFTISGIRRYPDPKTTALGGVATGSINAQEAATAAPTIKTKGWTSTMTAIG